MSYIPAYAGIYYDLQLSGPHWLPRVSLSSVTKLHDTASRTLLTQSFLNPSTVNPVQSAKYTFPLYDSCAVVSFRCYVGSRLIEGIIKEKQDASATYQAAVGQLEPAGLLEQQTSDVFSTSIGNIPPGETVRVEIEYIIELKHDAEVDGLRFTIPTSIAPRYGVPPSGMIVDPASMVTVNDMNISVEVSMSSLISSVQSPSHPITLYLGGHTPDIQTDTFNPMHALATLNQLTSASLTSDFILLIRSNSLSTPSALLETHPTLPNSQALMITLIPKFNLPESSRPEVVFIVDRSGSMIPRIASLKSSLTVFLRSLPLGVNFNICSFGSTHSFLWARSRPYTDQTFAEAQRHCDAMQANLGGTEILPPIQSVIARRFRNDMNLEIMLLTDGQVWNSDQLLQYVGQETERGDVRLFSLGIGRDISYALVDGLARVGRGFSQVVADEREGMESKVARMLRGALSPHVLNYRVEWEGRTSADVSAETRVSPITRAVRRISLFDTEANADAPVPFSDPPDFVPPSVLQAPYKLPPLFPFSRSTAYAILSSTSSPPSHVWLRGTTPAGDELELDIPVHILSGTDKTIHQLAARKILQELKDGNGYLHAASRNNGGSGTEGVFEEWVKNEGVRVGLKYEVASQWTSFVAVMRREEEEGREGREREGEAERTEDVSWSTLDEEETYEFIDADEASTNSSALGGSATPPSTAGVRARVPYSFPARMAMIPPPPPIPYPTKKMSSRLSSKLFPDSPLLKGKSDYSLPPSSLDKGVDKKLSTDYYSSSFSSYSKPSLDYDSNSYSVSPGKGFSPTDTVTSPPLYGSVNPSKLPSTKAHAFEDYYGLLTPDSLSSEPGKGDDNTKSKSFFTKQSKKDLSGPTLSAARDSKRRSKGNKSDTTDIAITYSPPSAPPAERLSSETAAQPLSLKTKALIDLQTYEGCFVLDSALATLLGVSITDLETKLSCFTACNTDLSQHKRSVWATLLAIKVFETQLAGERSVWQLVVDKARTWMRELGTVEDADVNELEKLAYEVLGV